MKFLDGTIVPKVTEAEYLGGILHHKADPKAEIAKRISVAGSCRYQLGNFWRRAAIDKKRKIRMYEAIVTAKLTYALEIAPLTQATKDRLDATYYKGLRQIMGMKTTFAQMKAGEEPTNTNKKVLEEANKELKKLTTRTIEEEAGGEEATGAGNRNKPVKEIEPISARLEQRAIKALGEYLRAFKTEPVNEVIRGEEDLWKLPCREYHIKCREGPPRANWLIDTATLAWDKQKLWKKIGNREYFIPVDFNHKHRRHISTLIQAALRKAF